MPSQHTTHSADSAALAHAPDEAPERLPTEEIVGRYRTRIERLDAAGLAQGKVIKTLLAPDWSTAEARGIEPAATLEQIAVVGALPGEIVEVEARWWLPWQRRKRKRLKPP